MKIAILSGPFFHDCKEVKRKINGEYIQGTDRIIYGGAEKYMIDLCEMLQSMGHTVTVYQPFNDITKPFAKQYKGITFVMIPNSGQSWAYHTCTDLNWQFNELSAMDDLRIYFATYLAWPNAVSPCIAISHGIYWDNIQGNNIINNFTDEQRREFFKRQLYGFTAPDVVVSVDSNVRKVVQAMMPGNEKQIQIIYNYVDTQKFVPVEKTWEGINVLFPRRLTALRGSTEITRAFVNYPQYNFVLVGQAHDENAAQAFAAGHKNRGNVTFTHKETDEMPDMYKNIDISIVPTIASEGLSLSLLESMASGLPVITTPVGGLGDAVIPGYNAFVYDPNHEDLGKYIDYLAQNPDIREKFGKRNREIAVECFDIEIWKARWRNLLAQFGAVAEKKYTGVSAIWDESTPMTEKQWDYLKGKTSCFYEGKSEIIHPHLGTEKMLNEAIKDKPHKPKLVTMMLTHNEADRYLERVIENTLLFCDEIVILDDHSTDDTVNNIAELKLGSLCDMQDSKHYANKIYIYKANNTWENESRLRQELIEKALEHNPDWLIAIDADELYEADKMNEQLPYLMSQTDADWVGFRFFDMWDDEEHYRDDDIWPAGTSYAPRMFRVTGSCYEWLEKRRHCGSIPESVVRCSNGINSSVRVKHLGWMKPEDRDRKYLERLQDDPNNEFYPEEVYDAILSPNAAIRLVKWDDKNPWQTGKLTIAYPPGMEWNIMQQRPHHLLRLAAGDRNRIFFGDDSAPGTYEPLPYLTVVNGEKDLGPFAEEINADILYITSPEQMKRCQNVKYKKLVYDCCDWMGGADSWLIEHADHILCASRLLYDKVRGIVKEETSKEIFTKSNDNLPHENVFKVIYLPNACDFDHFSKTGESMPKAPEPIVGYMGCIHPVMIDDAIIKALAEKYRLLMIGQNKGTEFNHPNIYATGHVPYNHLPQLLSQCKVGIIPFHTDTDYLRYSAPIKVYEYLAAGRPVVASPIPELQPLADMGLIRIVANDDLEGWVKAVGKAINEYPNVKGQEWVKTQTWNNRYETLKKEVLERG